MLAAFAGVCLTLTCANFIPIWQLLLSFSTIGLIAVCAPKFRLPLSVLLAGVLGFAYASWNLSLHKQAFIAAELESKSLQVKGVVEGLPRQDQGRIRFDFKISEIVSVADGQSIHAYGLSGKRLRLNCYRCELSIKPNQSWLLSVRVKRPNGFASWGAFDYEKYLFRHRVIATGYVRLNEPNQLLELNAGGVHQWRARLRDQFFSQVESSSAASGMFNALALGDRSLLNTNHRQVFQDTGVSHLMAISGLHVGLVFLITIYLMRWVLWPIAQIFNAVPRPLIAYPIALIAAFGYAALAGFAVSTQRAIIMLSVYVLCQCLAREQGLLRTLLLAICVLLIFDPFSILDTGFWLSCLAVFLIGLVSEKAESTSLWQLQPWLWVGMLPVTALFFGQVSLASVAVNLLVVPLFCFVLIPAVLITLIMMLLGLKSLSTMLFSWTQTALGWVYQFLEWVAKQPAAKFYTEQVEPIAVVSLMVVLMLVLLSWRWLALYAVLLAYFYWPSTQRLPSDHFTVTLLDVGQGLSMVIEASDYVLVYDTGPRFASGFTTAQAVLLPFLRARGVRRIDHLVISHADNDHIGGLADLLAALPVNKISTSRLDKMPSDFAGDTRQCWLDQQWQVEGVEFKFLSPEVNSPQGSNNRSCVLMLSTHDWRLLITGDIERSVEKYLLKTNKAALAADIMLVPHQGSKTSSTDDFLQAVSPKMALLAAGYRNHYGHPHDSVMARYQARGIEVLSTVNSGTIELSFAAQELQVRRYRQHQARFWRR